MFLTTNRERQRDPSESGPSRPTQRPGRAMPRDEMIRQRAYAMWLSRLQRSEPGDAESDWVAAERALRSEWSAQGVCSEDAVDGPRPIRASRPVRVEQPQRPAALNYVLIIESDRLRAERLTALCRGMGLEVQLSPDPLHGLMCAVTDLPAAILLDAVDAWLDSRTVAEKIRRHRRLAAIPLAVVGEQSNRRTVEWMQRPGVIRGRRPEIESHLRRALSGWALDAHEEAVS